MKRGRSGFTLIEVLISLGIFAIISVAVYSAFAAGVGGWRRSQAYSATSQTARLVLEEMAGDLQRTVKLSGAEFSGKAEEVSFFSLRRGSPQNPAPIPQIRRVTYQLGRDDASGADAIFRLEESYAEGMGESHRQPEFMTSPVVGLEFHYASKGEDEEKPWVWSKEWEVKDTKDTIPFGVEIALRLPGPAGEELFTKRVLIPAAFQEK